MQSIELIRENLELSEEIVLVRIEEMRDYCMVPPTPSGGCHTLWILGHLAYIEAQVVREFMLGEENPLAHWQELFDGPEVSSDAERFPAFDRVLRECRDMRLSTTTLVDSLSEEDLDRASATVPGSAGALFGTYRKCLQFAANHWFMHRGQLADSRRAAGLGRMWF